MSGQSRVSRVRRGDGYERLRLAGAEGGEAHVAHDSAVRALAIVAAHGVVRTQLSAHVRVYRAPRRTVPHGLRLRSNSQLTRLN